MKPKSFLFAKRYFAYFMGILISGCCIPNVSAQTFETFRDSVRSDFDRYKSDRERAFATYRHRINAEFADYMRRHWPAYESEPAQPIPERPEPPRPIVKDPNREPTNDPIPFDRVLPAPAPAVQPQPVVPLPEPPETPVGSSFSFTFYGLSCRVSLENRHRFSLSGIDENSVADGWTVLSSDDYLPAIAECLAYRDRLRLGDWGYVRLLERMTTAFFSSERQNEARLMQMYFLTQSGYKVRMARLQNRLVLLLPSKEEIYEYSSLDIGGYRYYVVDTAVGRMKLHIFDRKFPQEQMFSLRMSEQPLLPMRATPFRRLRSSHDEKLSASVAVNRNLMEFYDDYPLSNHWDIYANASLSESVKQQLYPVLKTAIAGQKKVEAANRLLHFVQTAFEYQNDKEQFGSERPLFADETIFYPYSDCEDRAIFYSVLVRELLDLDVILLHYPGHLATAVRFDETVPGDHLEIDGRHYTVCDPTFIHADVGMAMPQYKRTEARVIRIAPSGE